MRLFLLTASAVILTASAATAQTWSGPYVSGFAGWAQAEENDAEVFRFDTDQDGDFDDTVLTSGGANAFSPGFCGGLATGPTPATGCEDDSDGGDFGLRAGYDWRSGGMVFGVVAEVSKAEVDDSVSAFSTTPARYSMTREIDYIAALRARAGFAFGRVLVYGTAGLAHAQIDRSFSTSNGANSFTETGEDDGAGGVQIGAGAEWAMTERLSLGVEYLNSTFDDDGYSVRAGPGTAPATNPFLLVDPTGTDLRRSSNEFEVSSWRLTASWRF